MAVSSLAGIDESALVTQAREGDTTAFGELVRRYEGKIFRLAQHVTQNREDAEDVLQETFMKAYEHLEQFKGDSKFYTWIVRIAVNQALDEVASQERPTNRSPWMKQSIPAKIPWCARSRHGTKTRNSNSRGRNWAVFWIRQLRAWNHFIEAFSCLRDIEELSTEETAEALGLSVPAVKSRLLRARLQLREKLTRFFKRKGDDAFAYM